MDFMSAQVAIMVQYMGNVAFMNFDPNARAITMEKVGGLRLDMILNTNTISMTFTLLYTDT